MTDTPDPRLPYSDPDNPADVSDVASELAKLIRLNAATVATLAAHSNPVTSHGRAAFTEAVMNLDDPKDETGQHLFIQETRFALCLLSFTMSIAGDAGKDAVETIAETMGPLLHTHVGPVGSTDS